MVGRKILSQVNSRLKAILDTSLDFGGVSIICFGDFHKLRPVKDSYVFQNQIVVLKVMIYLLGHIFGRSFHL